MRTVYQPLIDMRTGRPIGAEALVRWEHPTEGLRGPDQFIALADSGLEPNRLVLEITETVLMHDRDAAAATLWQLKGLGVRIAIDDFGTGYSSLAYLRR